MNETIWNVIGNEARGVTLPDLLEIRGEDVRRRDQVLAVLALLANPDLGILRMRYLRERGAGPEITSEEVYNMLRKRWSDRSLPADAWRHWATSIAVEWVPTFRSEGNQ